MSAPKILLSKPEPIATQKPFHGKKIMLWDGMIKVDDIKGWVNNPRLDLEIKVFKDQHAGREPDDSEIFAIMKSVKEFRLKELADDIRINGVRRPIIITSDNELLDGNRRLFAVRLILDTTKDDDPNKSDFESIPVWALDESSSEEDKERILVQENFYPSMKVEWSDYVKAQHIYEDISSDVPINTVVQKYGWGRTKVNHTVKIMELIDEFIMFAITNPDKDDEYQGLGLEDLEAERVAAEKYQHFNEAFQSLKDKLASDVDFKMHFFKWLYEGKFASFAEVRIAAEAWDNEKARKILESDDKKAGRKAKALIDYEKNFSKGMVNAEDSITDFIKFLENLTTEQKKAITKKAFDNLEKALGTVISMIKSTIKRS